MFDGIPSDFERDKPSLPDDYVDLSQPNVKGLVYILRHPEIWPEDFVWNYISPSQCAIGLASRCWEIKSESGKVSRSGKRLQRLLNIPNKPFDEIFWGMSYDFREFCNVTPVMVADKLDDYLSTGRGVTVEPVTEHAFSVMEILA